jgi:DNA-binding NarL/FixJ family response regulator
MTTNEPVRVMLVDDDPRIRTTLAEVCATDSGIEVVAQAGDGHEALARVRSTHVDVIVLDIRMPRLDGLAVLAALRNERSRVRVLMLTSFGEADYVRVAIAHDADGFLLKSGDPRDLLRAIHGVIDGETWLAPSITRLVTRELRHEFSERTASSAARRRLDSLSGRERAVVEHIAQGSTNAEIADSLHLTESTVKSYVSAALLRLGLRNRVEAAWLVWQSERSASSPPKNP